MIKQKIFFGLFLLGLLCWVMPRGDASESHYFVDPLKTEITVGNNLVGMGSVHAYNTSTETIKLRVIPKLWEMDEVGSLIVKPLPQIGEDETVRITPDSFDLAPGQSQLVRFAFKLPPGMADSEYHLQLGFEQMMPSPAFNMEAENNHPQEALMVMNNFATTVYAHKRQAIPAIKTQLFTCSPGLGELPMQMSAVIENLGNRHGRLKGTLLLSQKEPSGKWLPLHVTPVFNNATIVVLPGQRRRLLQDVLSAQERNQLPLGEYQLELQLADERNRQPAIKSTVTFSLSQSLLSHAN